MVYWLTIFFLVPGYGWVAGDNFDGWGSIGYETAERCDVAKKNTEAFAADAQARNSELWDVRVECNGRESDEGSF